MMFEVQQYSIQYLKRFTELHDKFLEASFELSFSIAKDKITYPWGSIFSSRSGTWLK